MTPPPRKYAEAPGTASSAAEMRPPADDSAMAIVSLRCLSSAATGVAREVSSVTRQAYHCRRVRGDSMTLEETGHGHDADSVFPERRADCAVPPGRLRGRATRPRRRAGGGAAAGDRHARRAVARGHAERRGLRSRSATLGDRKGVV